MQILSWILEYPCATQGVEYVMLGKSSQKDFVFGPRISADLNPLTESAFSQQTTTEGDFWSGDGPFGRVFWRDS